MKAILMSIRPTHSCNILNGLKTYEWRKSPLKTGDIVYGYVTKGKPYLYKVDDTFIVDENDKGSWGYVLNCTVPFRFVVGEVIKVEQFPVWENGYQNTPDYYYFYDDNYELLQKSCLTNDDLMEYGNGKDLYAHEITQLEIFDKPMQLSDFYTWKWETNGAHKEQFISTLKRAPQSYQYVYVKVGKEK